MGYADATGVQSLITMRAFGCRIWPGAACGVILKPMNRFIPSIPTGVGLAALALSTPAATTPAAAKTLAFVVTTWNTATYESRFMDECPEGLNPGNDEFWWRGLSKIERGELTDNGMITQIERQGLALVRGPNGENVCQIPTAVKDPVLLTVEGPLSYGVNLDGNVDGSATAKSCAHENFTGVDGTPGVDNQMYRLLGCTYGWRNYGHIEINANGMRKMNGLGMILIEITGVDDPKNDDAVEVGFYRSIDQFALDSNGNMLPYNTYRIDQANGVARYGDVLPGKIVDGVVMTGQGDVHLPMKDIRLPFYGNYTYIDQRLRDLTFRLEIDDDGASARGMFAGYYDVDQMWDYLSGLGFAATAQYSCPPLHEAIYRLADGYPDPQTGKCTAISSAFRINAVAAFIDRTDTSGKPARVAASKDKK